MVSYNGDLIDLDSLTPKDLFGDEENGMMEQRTGVDQEQLLKDNPFELQFNYILMTEIEGESKLEVSRTLKDCQDIELF